MATYRYWTGGNNTGGANNTNWAQAYNTLAGAIAAATVAGDIVLAHYASSETPGAAATYTLVAGVELRSVDKDAAEAYTPMGSTGKVGGVENTTVIQNDGSIIRGMTFEVSGSNARFIRYYTTDGVHARAQDMILRLSNTNATSRIRVGCFGDTRGTFTLRNVVMTMGHVSQSLTFGGRVEWLGGGLIGGTAVTTIFQSSDIADVTGCHMKCIGLDLTGASSSANIAGGSGLVPLELELIQCILPSAYVMLGTQTGQGMSGSTLELRQCKSGSTTGIWAYADSLGSVVLDTSIVYTGEAASYRITTTANASPAQPFAIPWVAMGDPGTSAITPRFEILRDGSSTAFTDAEVFAQFMVTQSGGTAMATDRAAVGAAGSAQATGAGLGSWTGESGTAWSGKADTGGSVTPVTGYDLLGRIAVAVASATVYVSPVIRT